MLDSQGRNVAGGVPHRVRSLWGAEQFGTLRPEKLREFLSFGRRPAITFLAPIAFTITTVFQVEGAAALVAVVVPIREGHHLGALRAAGLCRAGRVALLLWLVRHGSPAKMRP